VKFVKVDVDEAAGVAEHYGIEAMPTFKVFKDGAEVAVLLGANVQKHKAPVQEHRP
jgi:thioredoxin 1